MSHANRIEEVGGIKRVFEKRKQGIHDSVIFPKTTDDQQSKLRKYINNVHGNHPDFQPPKAKREQNSEEGNKEIIRLLKAGMSVSQIANETGRTPGSISGTINRHNLRKKLS